MKVKKKENKMKGYITLVVVIILVPFLLLQGINLVNNSIDIVHISKNSIFTNKKYINDQTCWEEILRFVKKNEEIIGSRTIGTPEIACEFTIQEIEDDKYQITLETTKEGYYSKKTRFILYNSDTLQFISSQ
jgi:hypothetical protein